MDDWHDPFADDETARERERRRAEREARREEHRRALADKVRIERPEPPSTAEPASEPPPPPPAAPPPVAAPPRRPPPTTPRDADLRRRRLLGLGVVLALLALAVYGVIAVADRIGGEEPPPPAPAPELATVTIPEGLDRRQIADVAKDAGVRGNYVQATKRFKGFDPSKYGAANDAALEGFLFPATYELPRKARAEDLVERQLEAFRENIAEVDLRYAKSKNLTAYDVLTIASMIEREVQVPEERRQVAAVIYNRLAAGNPLGIDATIRYEDQNYDQQLTESRLAEPTPYNTRVNAGLPPTPIGNPGLAAIKAAANPARNDNFYFVVKPGTCGEHFFTASEDEFLAASERYQQALEREGGSPTEC